MLPALLCNEVYAQCMAVMQRRSETEPRDVCAPAILTSR